MIKSNLDSVQVLNLILRIGMHFVIQLDILSDIKT